MNFMPHFLSLDNGASNCCAGVEGALCFSQHVEHSRTLIQMEV